MQSAAVHELIRPAWTHCTTFTSSILTTVQPTGTYVPLQASADGGAQPDIISSSTDTFSHVKISASYPTDFIFPGRQIAPGMQDERAPRGLMMQHVSGCLL